MDVNNYTLCMDYDGHAACTSLYLYMYILYIYIQRINRRFYTYLCNYI